MKQNLPRFEARFKVIEKMKSMGLWRSSDDHNMTIPVCSRTGDVLEPLLKEQWFAKSSKLFEICDESVKDGTLNLIPKFRNNLWNHYSSSFSKKDWCLSRQLWWGHQIPAYKCSPVNHPEQMKWFAAHSKEEATLKAQKHFKEESLNVEQGKK